MVAVTIEITALGSTCVSIASGSAFWKACHFETLDTVILERRWRAFRQINVLEINPHPPQKTTNRGIYFYRYEVVRLNPISIFHTSLQLEKPNNSPHRVLQLPLNWINS